MILDELAAADMVETDLAEMIATGKVEYGKNKMLTENTGVAMCDSGGEDGRHWQRNQKITKW